MGNYTSLSRLATAVWQSRRRYVGAERREGEPTLEETRYLCPRCEEGFAYQGTCGRCGEPTVDRLRVLPMSKEIDPHGARSRDAVFPALIVIGLVLAVVTIGAVLSHVALSAAVVLGTLAVGVGAIASPVAFVRARNAIRRRFAKRRARRLRDALARCPMLDTRSLPEETSDEAIRVRGVLRFEVEGPHVRVRLLDEHGSLLLPERGAYDAYDTTTLSALDALLDGDEVEVSAHGRIQVTDGLAYRTARQDFVIDRERPIHVFVTRRPT